MNADSFFEISGYRFENQALLEQALTHRSASRRNNNERLEFLGDSLLNLIIANHIYRRFRHANEGDMTRLRASLVKQATLARVARGFGLGDHVRLGGGELKSGSYRRASILSDALEALIGAVFLDSDFAQTEAVVLRLFAQQLRDIDSGAELKDPKTRLQEHLQGERRELPLYRVDEISGQAHSRQFTVSCIVADADLQGSGSGTSRKQAEQRAAQQVLDQLGL